MPEETIRFSDYPFRESVFQDIKAAGFECPTPVQAKCIPSILDGKDVIGLAQTGTGKTATFALPIIHRWAHRLEMCALVIAPTRELAQQIGRMFDELGRSSGIRVAVVVGGIPIAEDHKALQRWPNVLVATPGRLIDHIQSRSIVLSDVEILVVDEADRMHDMGFIPQIRQILEAIPSQRQTLMLTATMPDDVERIARRHMRSPVRIQVGRRSAPAERAEQQLFQTRDSDKTDLLLELLAKNGRGRVLVFVRTKTGVNRVARAVRRHFPHVTYLHSGREQCDRDEAMTGFREGRYRIMVATDIAARGLDVADIEHVINYDFPRSPEDYVHRIGRTARVGATGLATSFVTRGDRRCVTALEKLTGSRLPLERTLSDSHAKEPPASRRKASTRRRRGSRSARRGGAAGPRTHSDKASRRDRSTE